MAALHRRGITRMLVEGGPALAAAFLSADLVDDAVIFESPVVLGPDALDALPGRHEQVLADAGLALVRGTRIDDDTAFFYERG